MADTLIPRDQARLWNAGFVLCADCWLEQSAPMALPPGYRGEWEAEAVLEDEISGTLEPDLAEKVLGEIEYWRECYPDVEPPKLWRIIPVEGDAP